MKKKYLRYAQGVVVCAAILISVSSCTSSKMMTYNSYQNVTVGDNIFDVQSYNGVPYEIRNLGGGKREYVYIERIPTSGGADLFREYTFVVLDGRVVEKKIHESMASPLQIQLQHN